MCLFAVLFNVKLTNWLRANSADGTGFKGSAKGAPGTSSSSRGDTEAHKPTEFAKHVMNILHNVAL